MLEKFRSFSLSPTTEKVILLVILALFGWLRLTSYGDPKVSISGNDTITYVEASRVPLFSAEIMNGRRLLTTNLVYKIFEPESGYQILVNGSIETSRRVLQPGFDRIVVFQLVMSLLGWGMLAWFTAEQIRNSWLKILSVVFILAFAFTPQMADWDSILMSESLTFSLFALQLALMIKIAFILSRDENANIAGWLVVWGIVTFFWIFIKDTNIVTALITAGMIVILFVSKQFRSNKNLIGAVIFLFFSLILGLVTAGSSIRSIVQMRDIYVNDIYSHPSRIAILQETSGMPALESPEFEPWLAANGKSALMKFMLAHPGYPMLKILTDFPFAFNEIKQTYFSARDLNPTRDILLKIGDALHPESSNAFLMSLLLLIGLMMLALKNIENSRAWAWLALWLFVNASLTLIPTILGDTWGLNRHALFSTMIFRLSPWIFSMVMIDLALQDKTQV